MKLLRAICDCGFHTPKVRVGYHFHQWWFPVLDTSTGLMTDLLRALPDDLVSRIQLSKATADEIHPPFIAAVTQELLGEYADQPQFAFNPATGSTFECPKCRRKTLLIHQVRVTAICKRDCGYEYEWPDSEQHGCPKCNHRPHRFSTDHDGVFEGLRRTETWCGCSSSMASASHLDAFCPKCGGLPHHYETNGVSFCGIHDEVLQPYFAPGDFLFINTSSNWFGNPFPNAKLWGDADSDDSIATQFCPTCELEHQRWLATESDAD